MADLKAIREKAGLTQAQLAEKVGVSDTTIQNWEYNKTMPKGEKMTEYLVAIGVTNPEDQKKIIGEMGIATYTDTSEQVDNIPYFLFEDSPEQLEKIKGCYATAEELDMLAYQQYVRGTSKYASIEKRMNVSYPMEYGFFEKHGGFNATMNKLHTAWDRLGGLHDVAIEFAEMNPGKDYNIAALDRISLLDAIGKLMGIQGYGGQLRKLYVDLKTIEKNNPKAVAARVSLPGLGQELSQIIKESYGMEPEERHYGRFDGYITLVREEPHGMATVERIELTEKGMKLIDWFEED